MARRRRYHRRRRGFGAMVQIPGLGTLNKSVNTTDVLIGAAIGLGGTLVLKGIGNKMLAGKVPDFLLKGSPLVGGALFGGVAYALGAKKNKAKANAHLFGALTAGASVQAWDVLKTSFPEGLGDVVSLPLGRAYGRHMGVFVDERTPQVGPGGAMSGLLVDESSRNLGQLADATMSMGDGEASGVEELMDLD